MASFEQEIHGLNGGVQISKVEYCGRIQNIFQVDYRSFQVFLLNVQWFNVVTQGRNPIVQGDASGFVAIDSTKLWTNASDTFVLLETCEEVYNINILCDNKLIIFVFDMYRLFFIHFLQSHHGGT